MPGNSHARELAGYSRICVNLCPSEGFRSPLGCCAPPGRRDTGRMDVVNLSEAPPFTTKDGSEIRELLAHRNSAIRNQSLAEARLPVDGSTQEHFHPRAEEIYYITHGTGRMRIEGELREVGPGDAIAIPPGLKHKLWNTGTDTLRLLCCCAPCYENDDTVITEE
jgi:mannose-6-phosphate isomerase-like protein (cupin superfamily)